MTGDVRAQASCPAVQPWMSVDADLPMRMTTLVYRVAWTAGRSRRASIALCRRVVVSSAINQDWWTAGGCAPVWWWHYGRNWSRGCNRWSRLGGERPGWSVKGSQNGK